MNDAQLRSKLKATAPGKFRVDNGLYFRVTKEGSGFWLVRYTIRGKRREFIFGRYGRPPQGISLAEAKLEAGKIHASIREGVDPISEKQRSSVSRMVTVNEVANDWLAECKKRLANPQIPERVYKKDIHPRIGEIEVTRINPRDILAIIREVAESGRPAIANDALSYCRQIFNHSIKLGLISSNPASAFSIQDAGGIERSRDRALSLSEIKTVFEVFDANPGAMSRENYLAIAILCVLGIRKGELIGSRWEEFDFEDMTWTLPPERTKTKSGIVIPIPEPILPWLKELAIRANGSEYLFPTRRQSKRRGFISDDTLNHALAKLFGMKVDSNKKPTTDVLGKAGIQHFVVHDLRRSCRSLLAENGVPPHIAERCLNHKIQGIAGIYDRYDYLSERREALTQIAGQIAPFVYTGEIKV